MEFLYKFKFDKGEIFEIKYLDVPKTAPKCERFKWFIVLNDTEHELEFIEMTQDTRKFKVDNIFIFLHIKNKYICINEYMYKLLE